MHLSWAYGAELWECVCVCVFVGRGAVRETCCFSEKLTHFNAKMSTPVVLLIIS